MALLGLMEGKIPAPEPNCDSAVPSPIGDTDDCIINETNFCIKIIC